MLVQIFFGQDRDEFGETIEEVIESYCFYNGDDGVCCLKNEITEMLKTEDDTELEVRMVLLAENQFNPEPWGETWRSFLQRVLRTLPV
ncbi:hypothetical protein COO59_06850 [Mixta theicola]|uniref:CdiI immunity protein domain-containing protein n=2 Tax=Mixta theicola TaxID=1458355 RepID=A0A2K1QB14_9GAMM|nr:hypothetical protein COO59_06850 [Mixta theicola]GLR07976.1 hypothetical protein GCM10007905_06950 [Mixta theicola]